MGLLAPYLWQKYFKEYKTTPTHVLNDYFYTSQDSVNRFLKVLERVGVEQYWRSMFENIRKGWCHKTKNNFDGVETMNFHDGLKNKNVKLHGDMSMFLTS